VREIIVKHRGRKSAHSISRLVVEAFLFQINGSPPPYLAGFMILDVAYDVFIFA